MRASTGPYIALFASAKHDFGSCPRVFERIVVLKRNIQFPGNILESPTSTTEQVRPSPTNNSGAVQPFDLKLFKPMAIHGAF